MSKLFWSEEHLKSLNGPAIVTMNSSVSYSELNDMVNSYQGVLENLNLKGNLAFLPMQSNIDSVIKYLACLRASIVPLLLASDLTESSKFKLHEIYAPAISFGLSGLNDFEVDEKNLLEGLLPVELALLLSTSGSTGSPKLVRLSEKNISTNAVAISKFLKIKPDERAFCSMPLSYSYGLSVMNSHLYSGACVYLSDKTPFNEGYFDTLAREKISSISGVPFFYQMLFRAGFLDKDIPSLKVMTQAGGKLEDKYIQKFSEYAESKGINFYVMYGQTEATARISYVPPNSLRSKIGSIGIPISEGKLSICDDELVYEGPSVMLGYAEVKQDLFIGDTQRQVLRTGDLGEVDKDGFYYITGRIKRFVKLAGSRFGLDELESVLEDKFSESFLVTGKDNNLVVACTLSRISEIKIYEFLQSQFSINRTFVKVYLLDNLPMTANGKKDNSFFTRG
jgi:long-chain acyl-CoA synthetase